LRVIPMGRRNWLFNWTEVGAQQVGVIQSLLVTCRLHSIDPYTYLVDVLQRVSLHPARGVDDNRTSAGSLSPLYGVPISIKDAFETAGICTTCSHPPLVNCIPGKDATVVKRLKTAGGIVLGKTNLPEMAANI
jgi:Asp-tRNA(Asn)/Glu-tRNA(Gln) amidotransferase A subunit family amidase